MKDLLNVRMIVTRWLAPLTICGMAVIFMPAGLFAADPPPTSTLAAVSDSAFTTQGTAVDIGVLINDDLGTAEDWTKLATFNFDSASTEGGVVAKNQDGSLKYTPAPTYVSASWTAPDNVYNLRYGANFM
jgi:hypothetical protein